jgi:hypothetical protein
VRYQELRKTFFETEALKQRFHTYFDLFRRTGATKREEVRWNRVNNIQLDFDEEQQYIDKWIDKRLAYLDEQMRQIVTGINTVDKDNPQNRPQSVYILSGQHIHTMQGKSGIFISDHRKIIKKVRPKISIATDVAHCTVDGTDLTEFIQSTQLYLNE